MFKQDVVSTAHVMVVGCGALGNEVLKNLVLMGVRHLVVVDFDVVEADNLTRSVFFAIDDAKAGRKKALVIAERLQKMNPATEVQVICGDIAYDVGLGLIRRMDVVIGCVDNRWARYCINRLCMQVGVPWVDGGIDGLEGTARVFMPGKNCYACNLGPEGLRDLRYRMPCAGVVRRSMAAGKASTNSIIASVIGAVQVQEAFKLLYPEELAAGRLTSLVGSMFCYEGEHLTTKTVRFSGYDDDCPVHEQWNPIEATPMNVHTTVSDMLAWLRGQTNSEAVSILLDRDCFVDKVLLRADDSQVEVMLPGRAVEDFVARHPRLGGMPPQSALYQHEYRAIDATFPYQELTLSALGIPDREVLHVTADGKDCYFELSEL